MTEPGEFSGDDDETLRHIEDIINTLGAEATRGEEDFDRVLPDFVRRDMDDEAAAKLAQSDREGVPTPYALQFVEAMAVWTDRLSTEGSSPELIAEVNIGLASREGRYPDSALWDRARGELAKRLQLAGDLDTALDFLFGMRSKHVMARTAMELTGQLPDEAAAIAVMENVFERFGREEDNTNLIKFLQATYDEMLIDDPELPELDMIEAMIRSEKPDYEPVQSWAESMHEVRPDVDWGSMITLINDDRQWADFPLRYRQLAIMSHLSALKVLDENITPELLDLIALDLSNAESNTMPRAPIWDRFRQAYVTRLLENGLPGYASELGRAIRNAQYQAELVKKLIDSGTEDHAMQVAEAMTDVKRMVEVLLATNWSGNRGVNRLAEIVADESRSLTHRIECLIAARDRMQAAGNNELAAEYNAKLTELRQRLAEG
jgi:hypothetical protein